ncbi:MAG TPA: hypothetical protein V6D19_02625 [Stenomitos sp.]
MKILLERKLNSCPDQMVCTVCGERFWVRNIRSLLYRNDNLIQGDVCSSCVKLNTTEVQQRLKDHAGTLLQCAITQPECADKALNRALELLETSKEALKKPSIWQRLVKKVQILAEETRELEAARYGIEGCHCGRRSPNFGSKLPQWQIEVSEDELHER